MQATRLTARLHAHTIARTLLLSSKPEGLASEDHSEAQRQRTTRFRICFLEKVQRKQYQRNLTNFAPGFLLTQCQVNLTSPAPSCPSHHRTSLTPNPRSTRPLHGLKLPLIGTYCNYIYLCYIDSSSHQLRMGGAGLGYVWSWRPYCSSSRAGASAINSCSSSVRRPQVKYGFVVLSLACTAALCSPASRPR